MYLNKIINIINKLLSNSSSFKLNYERLGFYLDSAVDNINQELLTNFRTVSEYFEDSKFFFSTLKIIKQNGSRMKYYGVIDQIYDSKQYSTIKDQFSVGLVYNPYDGKIYQAETGLEYIDSFVLEGRSDTITTVSYYIKDLNIFVDTSNSYNIEIGWDKYTENNTPTANTIEELGPEYFDYNELPDRYIRSCLVYYTAALYLEEEDELENQYRVYLSKADKELVNWKKQFYSMYDTEW